MNRYEQVKDKKIGGGVILMTIILIALTGEDGFTLNICKAMP